MTNRDYVMGLSNEKLAYAIEAYSEICDEMGDKCERDCHICCLKWLKKERKSDVKKGQIRQSDSGRCYLIFMVTDTTCLTIGEKGTIVKRLKSLVETWLIKNDISIDEFTERIFNNL